MQYDDLMNEPKTCSHMNVHWGTWRSHWEAGQEYVVREGVCIQCMSRVFRKNTKQAVDYFENRQAVPTFHMPMTPGGREPYVVPRQRRTFKQLFASLMGGKWVPKISYKETNEQD